MPREIPTFATDLEESDFWDSVDIEEYTDPNDPGGVINYVGPPGRTVRLHLDADVLDAIEEFADRHRVGYETLISRWLAERIHAELAQEAGRTRVAVAA